MPYRRLQLEIFGTENHSVNQSGTWYVTFLRMYFCDFMILFTLIQGAVLKQRVLSGGIKTGFLQPDDQECTNLL
jgi:hypothetical protein